jgi:hypothetical protein
MLKNLVQREMDWRMIQQQSSAVKAAKPGETIYFPDLI